MLLVGTATCSALASAFRIDIDPLASVLVMGNLLVLGGALSSRFEGILRGGLLTGFAIVLIGVTTSSVDPHRWWVPSFFFSPAVLLSSLSLLAVRDGVIALKNRTGMPLNRMPSHRVLAVGFAIISLLIYMVIVPSVDAYLDSFRERPNSYTIEELSSLEQLRIRSAKLAVFAIFAYFGACVASFINVVAASAPRGDSIALRSSACPKCETAIRRIDNLPLFSYANLGGRCRHCVSKIPIRYFLVEWIGAVIFGSLFLLELITGAANVPGFPLYMHTGILWIILYTKWPVVGIYFYHAAMMSCLLMLGLMDLDRLRCPRWLAWSMLVVFAVLPIAIPVLRPVAIDAQVPIRLGIDMTHWGTQVAAGLIGGVVGWLLGWTARSSTGRGGWRVFPGRSLPLGMALVGVSLGWQAAITIAIAYLIAGGFLWISLLPWHPTRRIPATAMLLAVVMIHHPGWKWLASYWPN
ncbi:Leader peptidase PppA [Neorhodopirellula pilleata]|uniref:Leader peptidase PppA n=2 Tax=Neorhodopirellula pilleata TaxID=2714738 RepID=A0A5C6A9B1_9BACT|nr:Leader peptidase PppA [Neorhodopirellula pilleata]